MTLVGIVVDTLTYILSIISILSRESDATLRTWVSFVPTLSSRAPVSIVTLRVQTRVTAD